VEGGCQWVGGMGCARECMLKFLSQAAGTWRGREKRKEKEREGDKARERAARAVAAVTRPSVCPYVRIRL
jgi:hypothetical protein